VIHGRTALDGSVEFYDDSTGTTVATISAAGLGGAAADWNTLANKPSTFPPTIGATSTTAVAGNDTRLTAGVAGTATVRAIGTTATTACAGNDARLLTGSATAVNNSVAADVATLVTNFNALLVALRARGIITGS
jgi:hypothetical protein